MTKAKDKKNDERHRKTTLEVDTQLKFEEVDELVYLGAIITSIYEKG